MFARTKRLMLRPGWPEDARALACAIGHEPVVSRLTRVPWPYTMGDAEAFLAMSRGPHEPRFMIETMDAGTPTLIGGIGISDTVGGCGNLGYWLTPNAWGHGYATEAGTAVVAIARHALGLRRLEAAHFIANPASGRVLGKLGFRATGRIEPRPSRAWAGEAPCALFEMNLVDADQPDMSMAA